MMMIPASRGLSATAGLLVNAISVILIIAEYVNVKDDAIFTACYHLVHTNIMYV